MTTELVKQVENTSLQTTSLTLPKYDELNNQRILKEMQKVFSGFDFDEKMKPQEMFKTAEQIESYAKEVVQDIETCDNDFKVEAVLKSAAISAKRWQFGWVISRCLATNIYGSDLAGKLAKAAGISTSYLYQYRAVGERLSLKDAYILGLYGLGWDLTRQLGALEDDDIRKALIVSYVSSITDWNNTLIREQARVTMKNTLDNLRRGNSNVLDDTTSTHLLESAASLDQQAPEFVDAFKQIEKLATWLRALIKDKNKGPFLKAAQDCFLMEDVPGAPDQLASFHDKTSEVLQLLTEVEETLPLYKQELESLSRLQLTKPEN